MKTLLFTGLILLAVAVTVPGVVLAQDDASSTPAGSDSAQKVEPIQAIPASEIPSRTEEASQILRDVQPKTKPYDETSKIAEEFPPFQELLLPLRVDPDSIPTGGRELRRLAGRTEQWEVHKIRLDGWLSTLRKRSRELEESKVDLSELRGPWAETERTSEEENLPGALRDRVSEIIGAIDSTTIVLQARLDTVLVLQDMISQEQIEVGASVELIRGAQTKERRHIFEQDAPTIWKGLSLTVEGEPLQSQIKDLIDARLTSLDNYLDVTSSPWVTHLVIIVFLVFSLGFARWKLRGWEPEEKELQIAVGILGRPIALGILLSLFAMIFVLPNPPVVISEIFRVIGVLCLIRIVPILVPRDLWFVFASLGLFFVFDLGLSISPQLTGLERILLLLTTALAIGCILIILKKFSRIPPGETTQADHIGAFGFRIALVLLFASVLANILGFVGLSRLVSRGVFMAGFGAGIIYSLIKILLLLLAVFFQSGYGQALRMVRAHPGLIKRRLTSFFHFLGFIWWVNYALQSFQVGDQVWAAIVDTLGKSWQLGSVEFSLGSILAFIVTLILSFRISRFITFVLDEDVLPRMPLPRGVPSAISRITSLVLIAFGFILAAGAAGIELSQFSILAGALGVGVGFGLQGLVNNFVSGLILVFERPIQVGDTIEFGTRLGEVRRIGIRSSTVRTFDGAEVIVPNSDLISKEVVNWTLSDRQRRIEILVGVKYGTDPNRVLEILIETAKAHKETLVRPGPVALFKEFGDNSLNFSLRFWTGNFDNWVTVASDVTVGVNDAFKREGIEIPFPQRDLHIRSVDREAILRVADPRKANDDV